MARNRAPKIEGPLAIGCWLYLPKLVKKNNHFPNTYNT